MSKNDMDVAIEHAKETKRLFNRGDIEGAYTHYMSDPMGGGNPEFNNTQKDQFVLSMQRMSGGSKAAISLTPNERQAWCEAGADDAAIEMIAEAGGFDSIRVNGRKLSSYQDLLDDVMHTRIYGVCFELAKLGWQENPVGTLSKVVDDVNFQAKLVCSYIDAGKNVVGFEFDVIDVSQMLWSHNVVDNNMSLSMAAMAEAIDGVAVAKALGAESSLSSLMSDIEQRDKSMVRKAGALLGGELREWPQFPEQWTLDEYVEWFEGVRPPPTHRDAPPRHEHIVIEALREGRFVPALVLADYPEVDLEAERDYKPRQERLEQRYKIALHEQEKADDKFREKYPAAALWDAIKSVPDWNYGRTNTIQGIKYLVARIELDGEKYTVFAPIEDKGESRIYLGDVDSRPGEVPFAKHGVAYPGSVLNINRTVVVDCIKSEGVVAMEKSAGNLFGYYINLDERGSFSADVRNAAGETVYEVKAGNELGEDESSIIEDGFMKHTTDIDGLCDYLKSLGVIPKEAKLLPMREFEQRIEDEGLEDECDVIKPPKEFELGVADSYDQSYGEAEEIAGERDGWLLAYGNEARIYEGRVLGVTEHHVVQSLGKTAVIHHKANLDRVPETDEVLSIAYDGAGRGAVEPQTQNKSQGLTR